MFKLDEIPFWAWLSFSMIYFAVGNPDNITWSGLYFIMNHVLIIWLFSLVKYNRIKISGMSLGFSLLIFSVIKFFIYPEIERFCIFILFLTSIVINIYLLKRK